MIHRVLFEQPVPEARIVQVVRTSGCLCGPLSIGQSDGLIAADLESGKTLWEARLDKPLYALFTPKEGYLGVGLLGGDIRILDARTGDLILARRVAGAHAVTDGTLFDGTLLVKYATLRERGLRYYELAALDVATEQELWRREDVFPLGASPEPIPIIGGRIPVALRRETRRLHHSEPTRVTLLDVRTGFNAGEELPLHLSPLNGDLLVLPDAGVVVIGQEGQIQALRIDPPHAETDLPQEGKFATDGA